ncbi:MAG: zinc-binding dehydrogenase [Thaumarchaeota archaeon]|nr:zinc-binding dehydrogenase [Candidatus Terraquivivens yellowstonensis]MCL7392800.1 zinc-binding dehydrogenase [Candidatus Terraquivivens yellowstonensis]MCL7398341.1 zinc-binding dehydrogenase [Candidatus Terraquivivens yellowstonensis]MCL7400789.1 zinc-binding dehydrogenase [Candidatus Terraquivivens yellowstonensis]
MRAVLLKKFKELPELTDFELDPSLGSNEVLLEVEMSGLCYRDLLTIDGYFPRTKLPIILGHEIAGKVLAVGEDVVDFKPGDRVASLTYIPCGKCKYCKSGNENLCKQRLTFGEEINGSFAQMVKVHERSLVKVPDNVTPEGAAIASCVTGMVLRAFRHVAKVKQDESVLITGAGGGVGIHAVQVAKALGCKVIAATSSEEKFKYIMEAGADEVLLSDDKMVEKVKRLTGDDGVDVVLEAVGQPTFEKSLRCLAWGGRMVVVGNVTASSVEVPLGLIILKANSIAGTIAATKKDLEDALKLTADGKVRPVVTVYPLEKIYDAMEKMRRKESVGRLLLKP